MQPTPHPLQIATDVMSGARPDIPEPASLPGSGEGLPGLENYVQLLRKCWAQDAAERPDFGEIATGLR